MTEVEVRDRRPGDLDAVAAAMVEVNRVDGAPVEDVDDPRGRLDPPGLLHAWVGTLDAAVVGHALVTTAQPDAAAVDAWVEQGGDRATTVVGGRLFVAPAGRGHGLGRKLARAVTDWAAHHALDLVADVVATDTASIAIYERLGWQRIGSTVHDIGHGTEVPAYVYVSTAPAT